MTKEQCERELDQISRELCYVRIEDPKFDCLVCRQEAINKILGQINE